MNPLEQTLLTHCARLELIALMHLAYLRPELAPEELALKHEELLELVQSEEAIAQATAIIKARLELPE